MEPFQPKDLAVLHMGGRPNTSAKSPILLCIEQCLGPIGSDRLWYCIVAATTHEESALIFALSYWPAQVVLFVAISSTNVMNELPMIFCPKHLEYFL